MKGAGEDATPYGAHDTNPRGQARRGAPGLGTPAQRQIADRALMHTTRVHEMRLGERHNIDYVRISARGINSLENSL